MKPRDLLLLRIRENLLGPLESRGFRFAPSGPRFSRKVGHARQVFGFSLSKWNQDDDASFWTLWSVTSPEYTKWHLAQWGARPANNSLGGLADWNIPGWSFKPGPLRRIRHRESDADEMTGLLRDIEQAGLPFLDSISTWEGAAEWVRGGQGILFPNFGKAADFLLIAAQTEQARTTLAEGIAYFDRHSDTYNQLPGIRARLARHFSVLLP